MNEQVYDDSMKRGMVIEVIVAWFGLSR
jgi:hypothetical protein